MSTNNAKQTAWIAIGSLCSFGFTIVSSMILSRFFSKDIYGTYKQVLYVYNTLLTVFTLGLPQAYSYFLPRISNDSARSLIKKISKVFVLLGFAFSVLLFCGADYIAVVLKNSELGEGLRYFAIVPIFMLPTMGLESILATYRKSMYIAIYTVLTRIVMLLFVVAPVVLWDGGLKHAIIGFDIASLLSFLLAVYLKYLPVRKMGEKKTNISYKEIFRFSIPLLFASIFGIIITSADQFFVSRYYGTTIFADFANGSIDLPFVGMIIAAMATVLSPLFSRLNNEGVDPTTEIFPIWESTFEKSIQLIYPLVIYCLFFADTIMVILYGEIYESSSIYFRIRLITNFFTLIAYAPLLINIGKVKLYANVQMYGALLLIGLEYLVVKMFDTAIAIGVVSTVCTIGRIFFLLCTISKYFRVGLLDLFPIKLIMKILIPSAIILFIERYVLIDVLYLGHLMIFILSLLIYAVVYLLYCCFIKIDYISIIQQIRR